MDEAPAHASTFPHLHRVRMLHSDRPQFASVCNIRTQGRVQGSTEGRAASRGEVVGGGGGGGMMMRLGEEGEDDLLCTALQLHPCSLDGSSLHN